MPDRPLSLVALLALVSACATTQGAAPRCPDASTPYASPEGLVKGDIVHVATGRHMSVDEALAWLAPFRVVYVGESHDSADDHAVQLRVLGALMARGDGPVALGVEMLPRSRQPEVDAWLAGTLDDAAFEAVWKEGFGDTWRYYRGLLEVAKAHGLKVIALNAERSLVKAVREAPPDELAPEIAARIPELDLHDPWHRALIGAYFAGHTVDAGVMEGFYRAQVLWDETMADTAARFLTSPDGAGSRLLVIAGGMHVRWGVGIPRRLFRRVPAPFAIVEPFAVEIPEARKAQLMDVTLPTPPMRVADLLWAVGYEDVPKGQAAHPPVPAQHPPLPANHPPVPAEHPPVPAEHPPVPANHPPLPANHPPVPSDP